MKIGSVTTVLPQAAANGTREIAKSFAQIRTELATPGNPSLLGPNMARDFEILTQAVLSGKSIPPQQLLLLQVKAGQYSLRVELISKAAEAAVSTIKRLQNPQ